MKMNMILNMFKIKCLILKYNLLLLVANKVRHKYRFLFYTLADSKLANICFDIAFSFDNLFYYYLDKKKALLRLHIYKLKKLKKCLESTQKR